MRAALAAAALLALPAGAEARTWHVRAGAPAGGTGTVARPLASLADLEARSRAGDRLVVLPAARPLDGGLRLKARQHLVGLGPPVTSGTRAPDVAPRLTNTDPRRLDGDAVRLASGARVTNVAIAGPLRGGLYGKDVTRAVVRGVDVSGHNTSCTPGFLIPPFNVPTTVPGVGVPISEGLHNGWAGIMVDVDRGRSRISVAGSRVRDADCGDGIDVRVAGRGHVHARITGNEVRDLRQGPAFESLLAFGLQTRERGRLVARLDGNRQAALGNDEDAGVVEGADSEGVFVNPSGPSSIRVRITRNRYEHTPGRGGFSANGLELVAMGTARALVDVRDSTFSGTPGDVLEQLALGTGARLRLRLDGVRATGSTGFGGSGFGDTVVIPGNNGDCLIAASGGARNVVDLRVRDTVLSGCANNGLTLGSAVANGRGPSTELLLDLDGSRLTGNRGAGLRIGNLAGLGVLRAKVQRTAIRGNRGLASSPGDVVVEQLGTLREGVVDLGGGPLGSAGEVCLDGARAPEVVAAGLRVTARRAWWGRAGGPLPGRTLGPVDTSAPLGAAPASC